MCCYVEENDYQEVDWHILCFAKRQSADCIMLSLHCALRVSWILYLSHSLEFHLKSHGCPENSQELFSTTYSDAAASGAVRVLETSSLTVSVTAEQSHRHCLSQGVLQNFSSLRHFFSVSDLFGAKFCKQEIWKLCSCSWTVFYHA